MERKGNNDIFKRYLQIQSEKEPEDTETYARRFLHNHLEWNNHKPLSCKRRRNSRFVGHYSYRSNRNLCVCSEISVRQQTVRERHRNGHCLKCLATAVRPYGKRCLGASASGHFFLRKNTSKKTGERHVRYSPVFFVMTFP